MLNKAAKLSLYYFMSCESTLNYVMGILNSRWRILGYWLMTRYALFVYRLILSIKALSCEIPSIVIFSCSYRMSSGRLFNTQVELEMTQRLDIFNVFPPEKVYCLMHPRLLSFKMQLIYKLYTLLPLKLQALVVCWTLNSKQSPGFQNGIKQVSL
jgi:hypothetical protein